MFLALAAQVALVQNPFAVIHPKVVSGPIFHADDYPMEARRNLWTGSVIADLKINDHGTVDECTIVESSGHKLLDDTTCSILVKRARFKPARDKAGNAVADTFRTPEIGWQAIP